MDAYQKTNDFIFRISDSAWIPRNVENSDYIEFLQYLIINDLTIDDIPDYIE